MLMLLRAVSCVNGLLLVFTIKHMSCCSVLTVVLSSEDLRGDVVGCSTEGAGGVPWSDPLLVRCRRRNRVER